MDKFARKSKIGVKLKKFKLNNQNEKAQKFIVDIGVWQG
jgi:hypothetical protein